MKKILILSLILLLSSVSYAHSENEDGPHTIENGHSEDEISQLSEARDLATNYRSSTSASIWPWDYFLEGNWIGGIFAIIIWIAALLAIGTLLLFVLGRHI